MKVFFQNSNVILLFNIYINDVFYFISNDYANYANYAGDNSPYATNAEIDTPRNTIENIKPIVWNKPCLLITKHGNEASIKIGDEIIEGNKFVKLLGVTFDINLDFSNHVSKKVSLKRFKAVLKAFIDSGLLLSFNMDVPFQNIEQQNLSSTYHML